MLMVGVLCSEVVIIDVSCIILPRHLCHSPRPGTAMPLYMSTEHVHTLITTYSEEAYSLVVTTKTVLPTTEWLPWLQSCQEIVVIRGLFWLIAQDNQRDSWLRPSGSYQMFG